MEIRLYTTASESERSVNHEPANNGTQSSNSETNGRCRVLPEIAEKCHTRNEMSD